MEYELDLWRTVVFLALVALGSFTQAFSGFALGLIVLGAVTALDIAPIPFTAGVVSLVVVINGTTALHGHTHEIAKASLMPILLGLVPGVVVGFFLLTYLDANLPALLRLLLGAFILVASVTMVFKPHPRQQLSGPLSHSVVGFGGGIFGGLFNTSGPPIIYLLYRQPLDVPAIRATLLAVFWIAASWRAVLLAVEGGYGTDMLILTLLCLPVIILTARLGRRLANRLPPLLMRRFAFMLLAILGAVLILPALGTLRALL
jgi:uncharacterized membrane protein YfcA